MKIITLMKLTALFFFTSAVNAKILDIYSVSSLPQPVKVNWVVSSNVWHVENGADSIFSHDSLAIVDRIIPAHKPAHEIFGHIDSKRSMTSYLINLVWQLSIDVFVQSSIDMNDYKNLVTGTQNTASLDNNLLTGDVEKLSLSLLLNQTYHSFEGKTADQFEDYEIPMPRTFWLCFTGLFGYISLKGKHWLGRYSWKINDKRYQTSYSKIFQKF